MGSGEALTQLRKESQDIYNRIHSIAEDAEFVKQVHHHYRDLPLLPNMRCGAWYTDPDIASSERAYFKSTDGHTNNWSFNLRRPNLHILPLIVQHHGLILVDSTRAGKRIPDALSKTVPIWCSVINRASLCESQPSSIDRWDTALYTPPGAVSAQEHHQIEQKLDAWAAELAASFYELPKLQRPLRPIWITPATTTFPSLSASTLPFYPIVCLSASKTVTDGLERRANGFAYIQGSGDDHELWSMGLTPTVFWENYSLLLNATRSALPDLVQSVLSEVPHSATGDTHPIPIAHVAGLLSILSTNTLRSVIPFVANSGLAVVWLTSGDPSPLTTNHNESSSLLCIQTPTGKKGQHHFLQTVLPRSMPFIRAQLLSGNKVCIVCENGLDIGVGLCVAVLTKFFHEDGSLVLHEDKPNALSKSVLRTRLHWIISNYPAANPSRTTLKRVNDFLLSPSCVGLESNCKNLPE